MKIPLDKLVNSDLVAYIKETALEHDCLGSPPVMATGCILVVEMVHEDGDRYLHTFRPDETTAWAAVGMAHYGLDCFANYEGED